VKTGERIRFACSPSRALAVAWALTATVVVRRRLRRHGLQATSPGSSWVPAGGEAGVGLVLGRLSPSCLERCLVLQRWLADHGRPLDVIIGVQVSRPANALAHAWLEYEPPGDFAELLRLPPP